jgi:hypothetical protein
MCRVAQAYGYRHRPLPKSVPERPFVLPLLLPERLVLLLEVDLLLELVLPLELELLLVDFDLDPASAGDGVKVTLAPASTTAIVEMANILATLFMATLVGCDARMIALAGERAKCIPS